MSLIPAAQYLRMSTEHQQYSLVNQEAAIRRYAVANGFLIVRTYDDAARSGVTVKNRCGLRQLLADVVSGVAPYQTVLVYDVSRWGRFQDSDEAAHYEFICKSAGVPVRYCAEPFSNEGGFAHSLMKSLKRTLAGEFSRKLSETARNGKKRVAALGYRVGGTPGLALRRMLVSEQGVNKGLLQRGELKGISTDRVILVPGPRSEVKCVHAIYRMVLKEGKSVTEIVRYLNARRIKSEGGGRWTFGKVHGVLTNPKYMGANVCGRTLQAFGAPAIPVPQTAWVRKAAAFIPVVDPRTFYAAQRLLQSRTLHKSNEQLLQDLKNLLTKRGKLTSEIIAGASGMAGPTTYNVRFGGLRRAYDLVGYRMEARVSARVTARMAFLELKRDFLEKQLLTQCGAQAILVPSGGNLQRRSLRLPDCLLVSIVVARTVTTPRGDLRWAVSRCEGEQHLPTLLCRCNAANDGFEDFYLFSGIKRPGSFRIQRNDAWLTHGLKVCRLSDVPAMARQLKGGALVSAE